MRFNKPNTYLIISTFIVLVAIATWIVPSGEFERTEKEGKTLVVNNTYHKVVSNPQTIGDILLSPINGFIDAAAIIGFVLIVGGAFGIFQKTEALDNSIKSIAVAYKKSKTLKILLIPIIMTLFSLGGAVFGMSEEVIPFILFFVPLFISLGYDSITGVAVPYIGAGAGFAGAFINPFTVGIAQGIAELPPLSGIEYRIFVWFIVTATAVIFVSIYAQKIKKKPELSLTFETDNLLRKKNEFNLLEFEGLDKYHKRAIIVFGLGMIILVYGVLEFQWYIKEICGLFIAIGIISGLSAKLKISEITDSFLDGAKQLIGTAFIIAFARGIFIIASEGKIIDTILFNLSEIIAFFHPIISSQIMFLVQSFINFFVPSGSGQAALTMPIMAPLSDLVGVSRQTAVLAFQFGDGFSNMIIPTSAVTMGVLSLANIPYDKWLKWILPLQLIFVLVSLILLIPPYFINW